MDLEFRKKMPQLSFKPFPQTEVDCELALTEEVETHKLEKKCLTIEMNSFKSLFESKTDCAHSIITVPLTVTNSSASKVSSQ